jgi:hypothetical protein
MSMGNNGPLYKTQKLEFTSQALGPLKPFEIQ